MATIDAGAAAPAPVKVTPARENTPEKAELADLFEAEEVGRVAASKLRRRSGSDPQEEQLEQESASKSP